MKHHQIQRLGEKGKIFGKNEKSPEARRDLSDFACRTSGFCFRMSLSQNRCALLRDMR
jgi:hypothetical protein